MVSLSDTPTSNPKGTRNDQEGPRRPRPRRLPRRRRPEAGFASETYVLRPAPGPTVTTTDQDAAVKQAFSDIQQQLANDPVLARQLQRAASAGDSAGVSQAISATGADMVAVGSTSQTTQTEAVRVKVKVDL